MEKMPRKTTVAVDLPISGPRTRNGGGAEVVKPPRAKRMADANLARETKNRKRAAFGDLTNAVNERQSSLSKHVKKGLASIGIRSKSGANSASSSAEINAKKFKLATAAPNSKTRGGRKKSEEVSSLPSSRKDSIATIDFKEDDDSEYESAEESVRLDATVVSGPRHRYEPPARPVPPPGVQDYDLENWNDPNQCSEYAMDIFYYYKNREEVFRVPDYISTQPDITKLMRAILVDWLVEVQESFELNHETLYTAVKILDSYMSKKVVSKDDLQLIGATSCLIACKTDERIPPCLDDFVYVCDDAYTRQQIKAKEREVLETVGFDVGYPLSYRFVRRYGRVCKSSMSILTYARYVLETALLEYKFNVEVSESKLAAAALVLALKVNNIEGTWVNTLAFYSGYTPKDLNDLVQSLLQMLHQYPKENLKTVRQKYSHRVFHEVALIPLPKVVTLDTEEENVSK